MRLLTCSRGLVLRHERDRLWHFFCHFAGYARRDEGDLPSCTVLLDWQRLFRENALAEAEPTVHLFAWLRIGAEELRLSVKQEVAMQMNQDQGLFSPELLARQLSRLVLEESPFRLRDVVVGRPGLAARAVGFYPHGSVTKTMAEFPALGETLPWRPPEPSHDVGPQGLGRQDGWLVELHSGSSRQWLLVAEEKPAASVTLRDLCKAVDAELPRLGFRAQCWLSSLQDPTRPADAELGQELLRDLRWTQAERLELHEVRLGGLRRPWLDEEAPQVPNQAVVLLQRHTTRRLESRFRAAEERPATHAARREKTDPELADTEVPHARRLLLTSRGVRQFEYHPVRPGTLLVGKKDGTAGIIDYDSDVMSHSCAVDQFPILGLSWFHTLPQWAVVGGSQAGVIRFLRYDEGSPGTMHSAELEPFQHLSSLSMNCTDDFFMTSGFCVDVGLYDVITGRRCKTFRNLHQNFINILRFSHRTPQIFATASFDHTCKVWDLRDPGLCADKPIFSCPGNTLNVMCAFASDDNRLLVSGVDEELREFDLRKGGMGSKFPVPSLGSSINYRRSLYIAGGNTVATVATNESLLRFYDAEGDHRPLGTIDFRTMLLKQEGQACPENCLFRWHNYRPRWVPVMGSCQESHPDRLYPRVEYLQSLRCHPSQPHLLSALVAASEPSPEAYVAAVELKALPGAR